MTGSNLQYDGLRPCHDCGRKGLHHHFCSIAAGCEAQDSSCAICLGVPVWGGSGMARRTDGPPSKKRKIQKKSGGQGTSSGTMAFPYPHPTHLSPCMVQHSTGIEHFRTGIVRTVPVLSTQYRYCAHSTGTGTAQYRYAQYTHSHSSLGRQGVKMLHRTSLEIHPAVWPSGKQHMPVWKRLPLT